MARLIYGNIEDSDHQRVRRGTLPIKLIGRHSLKAWGYRLGELNWRSLEFKEETINKEDYENEEQILEYELIDICIDCGYEQGKETVGWNVCEDEPLEKPASNIEYDADGIPMGNSREEIEIRRTIIHNFIQEWRNSHEDKRIFNENLGEYIRINQVFLLESVAHSVANYKSTKAVLMLEEIMTKAVYIGISRKKEGDSNQKSFEKMIVMMYKSEQLGNVKMTVGIKNRTHEKIEYSITVPAPNVPFVENELKLKVKNKRKKRSK